MVMKAGDLVSLSFGQLLVSHGVPLCFFGEKKRTRTGSWPLLSYAPWVLQLLSEFATVFVNYRVYDFNKKLIGVTGVGLAVDKVRELIEKYQQRYSRRVYFIDRQGRIALHGQTDQGPETIQSDPALAPLATQILTSPGGSYQYERQGKQIYLNSRLVPEFKWHLMEEQASHEGEGALQQTLWGNLLLSALVTIGILVIANLTLGRWDAISGASSRWPPLTSSQA